jgi:threonine/homoserine/homoserine lactone efflux protein
LRKIGQIGQKCKERPDENQTQAAFLFRKHHYCRKTISGSADLVRISSIRPVNAAFAPLNSSCHKQPMNELIAQLPPALPAFVLASTLIELTPGPNMGYLAIVALTQGRKAGYAAVAGVCLGLSLIGLAAAYGVAALIQQSDLIYNGLRYAGIAFLLWLAWEGWRGGGPEEDGTVGAGAQFLRGLTNNVLNPKAAVFYVAVLPEFVDASRPLLPQTLLLTAVYVAIATLIHALIVTLAGSLRPWITGGPREVLVRRVLSLSLAVFAVWFAISTAR